MARSKRRQVRRRHKIIAGEVLTALAAQGKATEDMVKSATEVMEEIRTLAETLADDRRRQLLTRIRYLLRAEIRRRIHDPDAYRVIDVRYDVYGVDSTVVVEHKETRLRSSSDTETTQMANKAAACHCLQTYLTRVLLGPQDGAW